MATMYREIPLYVPDMPTAEELLPWLKQIDERHWYTNFGPLARLFEERLRDHFPPAPAAQVAAMANGTLGLALAALDLPRDANILIPAFTFPETATAVARGLIARVSEGWRFTTPPVPRTTRATAPGRIVRDRG